MKSKLYKIMGVALTVVMLASLTVGLVAVPAGAAPGTLKWTKLALPKVEAYQVGWDSGEDINPVDFADSEGGFWATPDADVGPIAVSPDGKTLFAAVADGFYLYSDNWYHVLKSTDGGYSWTATGFFEEWWGDITDITPDDNTPIVDIVVSPDYADDETVFVATENTVYQSVDSGKNFACMVDPGEVDWSTPISDLDVALDTRGRLTIMVGANDDVYVFSTATGLKWQEQDIDERVIACAFSPFFADDELITAVITDGSSTWMKFAFGSVGSEDPGLSWGADIGDAHFTEADADEFWSWHARIGFPDDFDAWGIGNNVCFVGITTYFDNTNPSSDDGGDVYKIVLKDGAPSSATDLNIRGVLTTLLPTATEITSIDVCGNADEATILVGADCTNLNITPPLFFVYYSTDSGETWAPADKDPTGGTEYTTNTRYGFAMPKVVMAPDFLTSGIAYCSTWGYRTDAFQRTSDGGKSWNQISLIDYAWNGGYIVKDLDAVGYNTAKALHMTTLAYSSTDYESALWKRTGGKNWERIFSYANAGVTDNIKEQIILDATTMFAVDYGAQSIWRSSDNGATWPKKITTKPALSEVRIVSATTIYTGHGDGNIYWSTKSGVGWTPPDDNEALGTPIPYIVVKGDKVLVGSVGNGKVFVSSDGGKTIERLGISGSGPEGVGVGGGIAALPQNDLGFATNNIIYCTLAGELGGGVWRCAVNWATPSDSEWEQIDGFQDIAPYDASTVIAAGPAIALPPKGVLTVIDGAPVEAINEETGDGAGGLWRSVNPTDPDPYPYFEKENKGLATGDSVGLLDVDVFPTTWFCRNSAAANYYDQVVMFTDTLDSGVTLVEPTDKATGAGLVPAGKIYPKVILTWAEMAGATSYRWQLAIDSGFKSVVKDYYTTALTTDPLELLPNKSYYWRVKVGAEGTLIGAPLISPWSATYSFKTAIGASMARPDLQAPWAGQSAVDLSPTFEWSGIEWAVKYDFELSTAPGTTAGGYFVDALVGMTGTNALVSTGWKSDKVLEYNTRYYWHVKAIGVDTSTPWSDVGTFTTIAAPAAAVWTCPIDGLTFDSQAALQAHNAAAHAPVIPVTPVYIWVIVIIGAVLVIAVIVLIVTTRRVP